MSMKLQCCTRNTAKNNDEMKPKKTLCVHLTHWPLRDVEVILQTYYSKWFWKLISSALTVSATEPHWWVKIGSSNGLVPSGNKPLPEAVLTKICVATGCHQTINAHFIKDMTHFQVLSSQLQHTKHTPHAFKCCYQLIITSSQTHQFNIRAGMSQPCWTYH